MFTTNEILDIAIRLEKNGEAIYRQAIEKAANPELEAMLRWMADEELRHAQWFSDLKGIAQKQPDDLLSEKISPDLLGNVIGKQSFSLEDIDFDNIEQLAELLDVFIEFENDGILFYEMLQPFLRNEKSRELLEKIIAEEKQHIKTLREQIIALTAA